MSIQNEVISTLLKTVHLSGTNEEYQGKIRRAVEGMEYHIKEWTKDRKVDNLSAMEIPKILDVFIQRLTFQAMDKEQKCFIYNFTDLVHNWCIGAKNNQELNEGNAIFFRDLSTKAKFINNYVNGFIAFTDLLHIMKKVMNQMESKSRIPVKSFELAKHYVQSLDEVE